ALAVLLTGALTLMGWGLQPWFEPASVVMLILAGVLISAAYLGTGPAVLAALLGGAVFVYWFDHSPVILTPQDARHLITVGGLLASGLVVGTLAGLLRTQIKSSRRREIHAAAVNALSRDLTVALTQEEMLSAVLKHINQSFNCPAAIFLPDGVRLSIRSATPGMLLGQTELAAAQWTFEHRQQAGMGTGTHALAQVRCLPLVTTSGPVGVLAVAPREDGQFLSPDERELLAGFESLAALAIERAQLNDQARQAELLKTTEKLQAALLNSISHDLRTPLSTVSGAISSLLEAEQSGDLLDGETRLDLLENADEEADRLNRVVGNLLDMTRLEAGAMRVRKRASDVHDMIGAAITQASRRPGDHPVRTDIPEHFPDVAMDFVLMVQALYNLLDNAAKYSPPGAEITVSAEISQEELIIRVADRGLGIPPEDIEKIFDKFYRVQRLDGVGGTGLGLSICRGIVEVHGGRIWAENRPGGGAVMCVALPALVEEMAA
ncbi:MAG: DUF4118 domain-containing protein, partial [Anaerolineae bacterium]|nr:DUF4118 domain-containing protein [Anaerolineae bacterium]